MEQFPEPVPAHLISLSHPALAGLSAREQNQRAAAAPRTKAQPLAELLSGPLPLSFRRAPLAAAALSLALGLVCAHLHAQPASILLAGFCVFLSLTIIALAQSNQTLYFPVLALWFVLGMCVVEWPPAPPPPSNLTAFADGLSRDLVATVTRVRVLPHGAASGADADRVAPWEAAESAPGDTDSTLSLDLAVSTIEQVTPDLSRMVPAFGGLRLTVYSSGLNAVTPRCGDQILVTTRVHRFQRFRDPGVWQYADYLQAEGIDARANSSASALSVLGSGPPALPCRLEAAQTWASQRLQHFVTSAGNRRLPAPVRLTESDAGIVAAMLFGDRTGLDHTLRNSFERTGSFHLFVVSGVHIALLAAIVFFLARLFHAPDWLATLITLPVASAYAVFTGFGAPVQRSLAMVTVYLLARLLSRERDSLNALGAAVLLMLLWHPSSLFEAGFQMTLLAVIAIAGLAHPLAQHLLGGYAETAKQVFAVRRNSLSPRLAQLRLVLEILGEALLTALTLKPGHPVRKLPALLLRGMLVLAEVLLIGIVAELVMVLPMAVYFHRAAPFALPANMLVIPLVGILAPAAVLTFAAALVSPALALFPGAVLALLLHLVTTGVGYLGHISTADLRVPAPALFISLFSVALWLVGCWSIRRSRTGALLTALCLPCIAVLILWPEYPLSTPGTLEVTALDVGQGDSLLVVSPTGASMLVDAGGPIGNHGVSEVVSRFDTGEEVVSPYLWSRRIRRLDVVVLSHAHTDHMGGMPAILENFRPRELWVGIDPHSLLYTQLLDEAARLNVRVRHLHAGEQTSWCNMQVDVLAPAVTYTNPNAPKNDDSLVLQMTYGKASALLEGDAERPSEQAMLAADLVHPVTLLKVGHHGSNTSSTLDFLAAAAPRTALLSSGLANPFGHPRAEVIDRFAALGIPLLRTDRIGLSTVLLTPDGNFREAAQGVLFAEKKPD